MLRDGQIDVEASWGEVERTSSERTSADRAKNGYRRVIGGGKGERCREIDRELRAIARKKSRLEVDEARWLREAERHRIWRKLGFSTALEYLEEVFGYAPRTAKDRLRVAKELAELPELEAELREGRLPYSAARELTRVMTRATEAQWLARTRGKNLRDIEELVAGHKKGDAPDDPKDPALMTRTLVLKLAPRADALLQRARALFEDERGEHLDDEALIEAMCLRVLEVGTVESVGAGTRDVAAMIESVGAGEKRIPASVESVGAGTRDVAATIESVGAGEKRVAASIESAGADTIGVDATVEPIRACRMGVDATVEPIRSGRRSVDTTVQSVLAGAVDVAAEKTMRVKAPRPAHQIVVHTCDACSRAAIEGRGKCLVVSEAVAELARCDAEVVREADIAAAQAAGVRRPKATLTIPQKTRDLVWARDEGRCRFPGCRATRNLAVHHLEHRAHGGSHDESNLVVLCDGHHKLLHEGVITISGRAPDTLVFMRDGEPLVDARAPSEVRRAAAVREPGDGKRASRFDEVVTFEHAKQALAQLGYKRRAARRALEEARAHVGTNADVQTLVQTVLALESQRSVDDDEGEQGMEALARQALVQSGFSPGVASKAVASARAELAGPVDLATLIRAALQRCRG